MNLAKINSIRKDLTKRANHYSFQLLEWYKAQALYKKALMCIGMALGVVILILGIFNHNRILQFLVDISKTLRESPYGAVIIWLLVIAVSFPPLVGLSTLCSLTGMVYGVSFKGWLIIASSTAVGSTLSFLLFKYLLKNKAAKLLNSSKTFLAFATVLGQDKDKFLILGLLQLCPRPYSITNAAFASVPNLDAWSFMITGLMASPKYLLLIYVGSKLEHMGETKDTATRVLDFISMLLASLLSVVTGWLIYRKTTLMLAKLGADINLDNDLENDVNVSWLGEDEYDDVLSREEEEGLYRA